LLSSISSITEFPAGFSPGGIAAGPDGNLWFTGHAISTSTIGVINPTTHAVTVFNTPTARSGTTDITAGPDGNLWFTERAADKVGMINPNTHAITEFAVPLGVPGPWGITTGPDGNLWFAGGTSGEIGEINPSTHAVTSFTVPNSPATILNSISAGPDGNIWFTGAGGGIGMFNLTTHAITEYSNPTGSSFGLAFITTGPDGNLWFTAPGISAICKINPATGVITEFPAAGSFGGITAGPDGNLWFTAGGEIGAVNPTTGLITEYPVPYANAFTVDITTGPGGNPWFTDSGTNSIGVATLATSQLVVTQQPPASITAGSPFGFTVTAEDGSGNVVSSFNGTVTVALANNSGSATLGGTLTATATGGVATFSGLTLTRAASGYTLATSGGGFGEGVTNAFTVTPATAIQLAITQQPPATVSLSTPFSLVAVIEDQYGNVVTSASNTVTVALAANPDGATVDGTTTVEAVDGVVTFSNLTLNKRGKGYTLRLSSAGLAGMTSGPITVK
jgi:streptogramin lyase